jgi:alanine dehydrogenase
MHIGIPRERRPDEYRVGLTPAGVALLSADGHTCFVEHDAGLGAGFSDGDYTRAGASIVYDGEQAYGRADLVIKVARPKPEEVQWLRAGQSVMAFWHLASSSEDTLQALLRQSVTAIAYETIQAADGSLPVLRPMSQIAGRMSAHVASGLLQNDRGGKGILLGGLPGVPPAQVVILGAGVVGTYAARAFLGHGATVYVLDRDLDRLERLAHACPHVITMVSHNFNVQKVVRFADVLVGAVLIAGARAPHLVSRELVSQMRPRSLILDIAIDQGGCVETSRPTSHHAPTFTDENVIHYCVPNMPGVLGRTATHALNNATWPYIQLIANSGLEGALERNRSLAHGVATRAGWLGSDRQINGKAGP